MTDLERTVKMKDFATICVPPRAYLSSRNLYCTVSVKLTGASPEMLAVIVTVPACEPVM